MHPALSQHSCLNSLSKIVVTPHWNCLLKLVLMMDQNIMFFMETFAQYGEKTKLMTNCANGSQREINDKGQKLNWNSYKTQIPWSKFSDEGSKPEVLLRIEQATAALTKLKLIQVWRDNNISLGSKVKLMLSLVISIFLYACKSWTLIAELEKKMQAFEMSCY